MAADYLDGGLHVPWAHPGLAADLDMKGYTSRLFERVSLQSAPPQTSSSNTGAGAARLGALKTLRFEATYTQPGHEEAMLVSCLSVCPCSLCRPKPTAPALWRAQLAWVIASDTAPDSVWVWPLLLKCSISGCCSPASCFLGTWKLAAISTQAE